MTDGRWRPSVFFCAEERNWGGGAAGHVRGRIRGERRLTFGGCGCISSMACEVGEGVWARL